MGRSPLCRGIYRMSAGPGPVVVPGVRRVVERSALRTDDAEALSGRRFHHPPALEELDAPCTERLQPAHLGLLVVRLDVEVDAAVVIHGLDEEERFAFAGLQLAV